jgi:hypothetical protein
MFGHRLAYLAVEGDEFGQLLAGLLVQRVLLTIPLALGANEMG